jgi:hypothetical protein
LVSSSESLPWDSLYCYQSQQSSGTCSVEKEVGSTVHQLV